MPPPTAKVMADRRRHAAPTHGVHQRQRVLHQVDQLKRTHVPVIVAVPPGGLAITALVGCNDVVARLRQWQHDFAPAAGQLRKAVQQQEAALAFLLAVCSKPASSTCMVRPLILIAMRERMPTGKFSSFILEYGLMP